MQRLVSVSPWLVLALYIAAIVFAERHLLFGEFLLPLGDNAADDLLVSDAVHLQLLHGNYSRVGFNHPGPWFQYVAAAGELIFYDWTRLFRSYFAGQVFALSLTHGIALAFAYRLALLVTMRVSAALVSVLILAATIVAPLHGADPFVEFWNPYSYIGAALLTATGLAGLILRGPSWLPLLVLGCAELVHGHASFLGIVPMMLVIAMTLNLAMGRFPFRPWSVRASLAWAARHPGPSLISLGLIGVFAAPLVLDTLLHWPGQFGAYLHFAGTVPPQRVGRAAHYVASFIPGFGLWAVLLLMPPEQQAGPNAAPPGRSARDLRAAAVVVLVAGIVPAFWYAWHGIDNLAYQYLLLWFTPFAGVALVATLGYWLAATPFNFAARTAIGLVAAGVAIGVLHRLTPWTPDVLANRAIQRAVAQVLATAPPKGRDELFLDPTQDVGPAMWVETVSMLAALKRAGRNDFCIDPKSWHILFTTALRCDARHETIGRYLQVSAASVATGIPVLRLHNDVIETLSDSRFPAQANVPAALAAGMRLDEGWSVVESWGIWSVGPTMSLSFDAHRMPARFKLTLTGQLLAPHDEVQTVRVLDLEGRVLGVMAGPTGPNSVTIAIDHAGQGGRIELTMQVEHPVQPSTLSGGGDQRALGFGLTGVQITE